MDPWWDNDGTLPRVGNYWVVHTSPPTSRCPSTLKISRVLGNLLVVGMYNPINPSSRQCSYSNTNNVGLIVLCCCRNHFVRLCIWGIGVGRSKRHGSADPNRDKGRGHSTTWGALAFGYFHIHSSSSSSPPHLLFHLVHLVHLIHLIHLTHLIHMSTTNSSLTDGAR